LVDLHADTLFSTEDEMKNRGAPAGKRWLNYVVRVAMGPSLYSEEFRVGLAKLRHIEAWMAQHHLPLSLADKYGPPKWATVTVFFDAGDATKALKFRGLCGELGIASSLQSHYVIHNDRRRAVGP